MVSRNKSWVQGTLFRFKPSKKMLFIQKEKEKDYKMFFFNRLCYLYKETKKKLTNSR